MALGGVFGEQRCRVRHPRAQAQAGQEAQHQQLVDIGAVGRSQTERAKYQDRTDQHHFAAEAVSQRAGTECAKHHADQRSTHHRAEAGAVDPPILGQRGRNKPHGGGVEAIKEDDQETQDHHAPLIARQRLGIDKGLHVQVNTDRRLIHYCYFHTDGGLAAWGRHYYWGDAESAAAH